MYSQYLLYLPCLKRRNYFKNFGATSLTMRHLDFIMSFFLINTNGNASQMHYKQADTTNPESSIKEQMRNFKKQNRVQIHRFESRDSTITLGSNKKRSFLTSVMILNEARNENKWFFYDSNGVFRISIAERKRTKEQPKRKKFICSYYFANDNLIYKIEYGKNFEITGLLIEANKYQELAIQYLQTILKMKHYSGKVSN